MNACILQCSVKMKLKDETWREVQQQLARWAAFDAHCLLDWGQIRSSDRILCLVFLLMLVLLRAWMLFLNLAQLTLEFAVHLEFGQMASANWC